MIYEYRCQECKKVFDCITTIEDRKKEKPCPNCEGMGRYIISAPAIKAHIDSDRWVKNRESHMKKERRNMERHGTYD